MKKLQLLLYFLVIASFQLLHAQGVQISGKVTGSEDGQPVVGATVTVKGTTIGTTTDYQGKYVINVPAGTTTLVFSFVGLKTQEIAIEGKTTIDVVMEPEVTDVQEVVITAYGIKRSPKEMGYATAKVSNKEITEAGVTNVVTGLSGKVSGLQINTLNNGVNPDTRITLRGNRHILASNQALVVLDGVPVSATYLNSINPNDIESVNILKGASASALYGNDASNGVLVVTTKKGGERKPVIKISNITTFETMSYLPKMQYRFGSGSGEDTANYDPRYTFWIGANRNTDPYTAYENQSYGPEFNGQQVILGGILADGSYQTVKYSAYPMQKKKFFQTGITTQNDISYSQGDENNSFYISAQDVQTTGVVVNDKNRRTGARFAGARTSGMFHAEYTFGYTQTNTNVAGGEFFQNRPVYWNLMNTPPEVPIDKYKDVDNNKFANINGYFNAYYPNPYWQTIHSRQKTRRDDMLGSAMVSLKPLSWLEFSYRVGMTYNTINFNAYRDDAVYNAYMTTDPWSAGHNASGHPVWKGFAQDYMTNQIILTGDFLVKIDKQFGNLSTKLFLGNAVYANKNRYVEVDASSLVIPNFYNISNRVGEAVPGESKTQRNSIGNFADLTLGYKEMIFVHASGRQDRDSRLAKDNRTYFYPGADISLVLSEMIPALKGNNVLSYAKFRAGYSKTGQVALTNWYATLPSFSSGPGFPYGSQAGFLLSTALSNPLLKPEITNELETGLDLSFIQNRIHLEATYFKSNTKDQTIPVQVSSATGFTSAYINAGELENKGIELDLKFTPLLNLGKFTWTASVNYSHFQSKVLSLLPGTNEFFIGGSAYAIVGQEYPIIKTSDVYRTPDDRIIVDPVKGYPTKNPILQVQGHGNPNHILGIVNTFTYSGLTLNVVAEYRGGNVIYNSVGGQLDFGGSTWHTAQNGRQPFVIPNSVIETSPGVYTPNTNVVVRNASRDFWVNSDYATTGRAYVTSAAFWKIREVSLDYDLPVDKLWGGKVVKAAQVGLVGRNLLMFRPKSNIWSDPEFSNVGGDSNAIGTTDYYQLPPTRVMGFSVKLTF